MQSHHRPVGSPNHRLGFTLLELMLAVGLTSLLMAAVYGAMSAYWNLAMDSREEVERTQIARSLLNQIAADIRSCTFAEQSNQSDFDDSADPEGTTTDSNTSTDEAGTSAYRNGLIGTDRDLVLYISFPDRTLDYVAAPDAVGTTSRNSDLMIVRWLLADSSGGSLSSAMAQQHAGEGSGTVAGLARGSGGVAGFGQAIENNDTNLQLESTTLVAAEVENVVFEYFDGVDWIAEWDTSTMNRMPQAVRIELTLRNAPSSDDSLQENPRDLPSTTHTLVVPVPVATPYTEETAI